MTVFHQVFFFWRTKKDPFLAIFWKILPPSFCKLSPHKFSVLLLFFYYLFIHLFNVGKVRYTIPVYRKKVTFRIKKNANQDQRSDKINKEQKF